MARTRRTAKKEVDQEKTSEQPEAAKKAEASDIKLNDLELACFEAAAQLQEQISKRMKVYFQREMNQVDMWMSRSTESLKSRGIDTDSMDFAQYKFDGKKLVKRG